MMTILKSNPTQLTLTELNPATWSNNLAEAGDILTPFQEAENAVDVARGLVTVNDTDTSWGTLLEKIIASSGLSIDTVDSSGELQLRLNLDSKLLNLLPHLSASGKIQYGAVDTTGLTEGDYLVAGAGGSIDTAASQAVVAPLDELITAGEAVNELDVVYRDTADGKWVLANASGTPIRVSDRIGFVVESGGISTDAQGLVRLIGNVSGFVGLTAHLPVYLNTSDGQITQTIPAPVSGGTQIALVVLGTAISSTTILLDGVTTLHYMMRASLADAATLTIQHHADPLPFTRKLKASIDQGAYLDTASIGRWLSGSRDVAVRFDDGSGSNPDTRTTFKNVTGTTIDLTATVTLTF